jgi:hypothetical protein
MGIVVDPFALSKLDPQSRELGDIPKPSAGKNPCTLLGFRIWRLVTLSGGFAPVHTPGATL